MAKKTRTIGYFIRVLPRCGGGCACNPEAERRECEQILAQILRHVDHGGVEIVPEKEERCEFCGAVWTEKSPHFNEGCCDKDLDQPMGGGKRP